MDTKLGFRYLINGTRVLANYFNKIRVRWFREQSNFHKIIIMIQYKASIAINKRHHNQIRVTLNLS